jgi:hypothetical protein
MNYYKFKGKLKDRYGEGEDDSFFPDYADSDTTRGNAIELGKGRAKHTWDQGEWKAILAWSNSRLGININYYHNQLYSEMQKNSDDGL